MMDEANNRANNAEARLSRFKEVETRAKKLEARLDSEVRKAEELNDKLAALEQENKVLRQGALVSPGVASRSRISRGASRQLSLENGEDLGEDGGESPGGELARKREKLVIDHTQLLADQEELLKVRAADGGVLLLWNGGYCLGACFGLDAADGGVVLLAMERRVLCRRVFWSELLWHRKALVQRILDQKLPRKDQHLRMLYLWPSCFRGELRVLCNAESLTPKGLLQSESPCCCRRL